MVNQTQINEVVKQIVEKYQPEKIILFGSYADGIPSKDSDVDLLVIKKSDLPRFKRARSLSDLGVRNEASEKSRVFFRSYAA